VPVKNEVDIILFNSLNIVILVGVHLRHLFFWYMLPHY